MPYGLSSVFQCLINNILEDMLGKFIIAYINDILIDSPDKTAYVQHVKKVLSRLLEK